MNWNYCTLEYVITDGCNICVTQSALNRIRLDSSVPGAMLGYQKRTPHGGYTDPYSKWRKFRTESSFPMNILARNFSIDQMH